MEEVRTTECLSDTTTAFTATKHRSNDAEQQNVCSKSVLSTTMQVHDHCNSSDHSKGSATVGSASGSALLAAGRKDTVLLRVRDMALAPSDSDLDISCVIIVVVRMM